MLAIARYALKSPFHAATVVGVLAILSLFIPLVSVLSGAMVGLIILTQGLFSGARAILVSIVGISVVSFMMTQSALLGLTIGLVQWLPMMVLAEILRRTRSMSFTIVAGMGLALIAVVIQFVIWPDSDKVLTQLILPLFQGVDQSGFDMQQFEANLQVMIHWMTLMLVAVMYSTFIATLFAARWFQARLADSSGFRDEFYSIRLGQGAASVALVMTLVSALWQQDWIVTMALVMLSAFLYQGMAIAHSWTRHYKKTSLLVLLYVLMVIFPHVIGLTAVLGMIDNWMDFRKKLKSIPEKTD